ncbi:MAG: cardiolipin synthase B [Alteromonadaceae bacterium]|nr:cardiolipin synthase B [Alteromonadaceae bacterium]|tara:strand:+ start:154 stop:1278 length:1125 start_codon:yes stop_codon:yes gene_type:complete
MREVWRSANRFRLLPEGKRFIPVILKAIATAQHTLLVEQYLVESGRLSGLFIDALVRAADRGVIVLVLLDGYGSQGLKRRDVEKLTGAGVFVRYFNPLRWDSLSNNLTRDHRKLVVVDHTLAFTGGFCLVDKFIDAWYEVAIQAEGPVVKDWIRLFSRLWDSTAAQGKYPVAQQIVEQASLPVAEFTPGMRGRVIWARGYRHQAIRRSLHQRTSSARHRLWLCTPYFAPTRGLRRRLVGAARRGVDVRILLPVSRNNDHPGVQFAGQRFYTRLLEAGIRIFEFQPNFIHAKFCVVDDWTTIGSCNFDHWSLQWNLEANQEVEDRAFACEVAELFERNFLASAEIDPELWARRPWQQKLREWLYGKISSWLNRLR